MEFIGRLRARRSNHAGKLHGPAPSTYKPAAHVDWITAILEAIGIVILIVWTWLPIREFRLIHKRLTEKSTERPRE
jgi:hypothetical protein